MKEEILTDAVLREFLLGKINDEERARIESLFLTDSEAREKVLVVEQELIEDYLEDSLTGEDRENFKAIKDWALRENAAQTIPIEPSIWQRLRARVRLRPVFVIPIAVTALIAIVVGGIWLNTRIKRAALEQELAQLNTPASLREVPERMFSLNLSPVTVRSAESEIVIKRPAAETAIIELHLPWIQKERYPTYNAEIRRVGGDESFTIQNLQTENNQRYEIRLRFPARIIARGQHQVRLSGIDSGGTAGTSEEYVFTVDG
jgi:hypothetical protein